jgi:NAD(P)H-hydrate epimerase
MSRRITAGTMRANLFSTENGLEVTAVTVAEMREIDRLAMEELGPSLMQMMENAGRNLAEEVMAWTEGRPGLVAALAGSGGNGGGAICGARHLANHGVETVVCLSRPAAELSPAAKEQLAIYRETDGRVIDVDEIGELASKVLIDGLLGYSLRGVPHGETAALIEWCGRSEAKILSLDVPSGINATTGDAAGTYVRPDRTLTLALPKTGLAAADTGELVLADIGIPAGVYARAGISYRTPFLDGYRVRLVRTGTMS